MQNVKPDWAPDNCPDAVVQLIENDDYLSKLKLRGLGSPDSTEVRTAVKRLKSLLSERYIQGTEDTRDYYRRNQWQGVAAGFAIGVSLAGLAVATVVLFGS